VILIRSLLRSWHSLLHKTRAARKIIDRILLKIPILGAIFQKIAWRDSPDSFTLLSSGVPILQSLDITARTSEIDHRGSDHKRSQRRGTVKALSIH